MNYQIVIPARGGSKRFPGKNIKLLGEYPLIVHSILYALESFPKENVWVNTDDEQIAEVAKQYSVNITWRPEELGTDTASTADVLRFQCEEFLKNGIPCDAVILLQATNPLRPKGMIEKATACFENEKRDSLASFSRLNKKYGKIQKGNYSPVNYFPGQRMQDIDPDYYENGLIYITKTSAILNKVVITNDVYPMVIDGIETAVDIDEADDMLFAEYVLHQKRIKINL